MEFPHLDTSIPGYRTGPESENFPSTQRPSRIEYTFGNSSTALGSWLTMITVFLYSVDKELRSPAIAFPLVVSKFPVGSSARIKAGSLAKARAMILL